FRKACSCSFLLVAIRYRQASPRPTQVAQFARFQGHAASQLSRGAARDRGGNCWTKNRHFQRCPCGTRTCVRRARESVQLELAGIPLLSRPEAWPSTGENNPGGRTTPALTIATGGSGTDAVTQLAP